MLSSIPVQLTDLPTFGGETPPGAAGAPDGAGGLVTFAELLRRPIAALEAGQLLPAAGVTVPGLPPGGKNLPAVGQAGDEPPAPTDPEEPVIAAEAAEWPLTASVAPAALAPLVPAEYRFETQGARASKVTSSLRPTSVALPGPATVGQATGEGSDAAPGVLAAMLPLPSSLPRPEWPQPPAATPLDIADAPEIRVALGVADTVAPAQAGTRPEAVPEAALAGPAHDRAVLPDGASHFPQPPVAPQVPAAAAPPATAATPPQPFTSASLGVPVGEPAWADAFGDQVLVLAGKQVQRAEIRLHPAELGPIHVQITVEDDATTLAFTAQHAVTREAIEQALPRLRELFGDQGLSLLNTTVSEQGARQHDREAGLAGRGPEAGLDDAGVPGADEPAATPRRVGVRDTLIDMFA